MFKSRDDNTYFLMAMTRKYITYNPTQSFLLPPDPRDWLPDGHLALFISDTVDDLDISSIYEHYDKAEAGAPPFNPAMSMAVQLYTIVAVEKYIVGI